MERTSRFNRNPKKTAAALLVIIFSVGVLVTEICLRQVMGLGHTVLYYSYPMYGYRLLPNQSAKRFYGKTVGINNLSLRADEDWDDNTTNKILFVGDSVTYGGSYISNEELFSSVAVRRLDGYQSGNAGVNGWGIQNIHGLIVGCSFLPAKIVVTVVPEGDFYRGLTQLSGSPYWCRQPGSAFKELLYYFYYKQTTKRYINWKFTATGPEKLRVVGNAATRMKQIDDYLKSKGIVHLIYISPRRSQVFGEKGKDKHVLNALNNVGVEATYLLDRIDALGLTPQAKKRLFHDGAHLEIEGHKLWGEIIGNDLAAYLNDNK